MASSIAIGSVALLFIIGCGYGSAGLCPDQQYVYNKVFGKCYKFHPIGATWADALLTCQSEGATLAIINSPQEADFVSGIFNANHDSIRHVESAAVIRIGLRKMDSKWKYTDDTYLDASGYTGWGPGEPNNSEVNLCGGILMNGKLDDIRCGNQVAFICQTRPKLNVLCTNC